MYVMLKFKNVGTTWLHSELVLRAPTRCIYLKCILHDQMWSEDVAAFTVHNSTAHEGCMEAQIPLGESLSRLPQPRARRRRRREHHREHHRGSRREHLRERRRPGRRSAA